MQSTERTRTKEEFSFHSIRLEVAVGRFQQNCGYSLQSKVDYQTERFRLLTIRSVHFRRKRQIGKDNCISMENDRLTVTYKRTEGDENFPFARFIPSIGLCSVPSEKANMWICIT
uniref:Uncharacterized protein n=1 Tax=Romanomermis culicivorax TaxID=13658 RepID=A0A915I0D1_ROMCU